MPIIEVPVELERRFRGDPAGSLRKYAAMSTMAISPFFTDSSSLRAAIDFRRLNPFNDIRLSFAEGFTCGDHYPRFVHVDLADKHDAVGICMVHIPKFVASHVGDKDSKKVVAPYFHVDFMGRIKPQDRPMKRVNPGEIREIIIFLRDTLKFPILLVTYDQYQSVDSIMTLRERGFLVEVMSIDRTTHGWILDVGASNHLRKVSTDGSYSAPMEDLRDAFFEGRISVPAYGPDVENYIEAECKGLEHDAKRGVVVKSAHSADDLAQALAGAVFNARLNTRCPENAELRQEKFSEFDSGYRHGDDTPDDLEISQRVGGSSPLEEMPYQVDTFFEDDPEWE